MSDRKVSLDHVSEDYEDKDSLSDASFDDNNEHVVVNDVSKASTINDDSPFVSSSMHSLLSEIFIRTFFPIIHRSTSGVMDSIRKWL